MGTKLCFYTLDTRTDGATIFPPVTRRNPNMVNDTAPAVRWTQDLLEPVGEQRFREMVKEIEVKCAPLDPDRIPCM